LRDRVDGRRDQRLALARRERPELRAAMRAQTLPTPRRELLFGSRRRRDGAVGRALVLALPVDRHRRGDDEPAWLLLAVGELLQEAGGGHRVHVDVAGDLVHRLSDADRRREVHDAVDALERAIHEPRLADAAFEERRFGRHSGRRAVVDLALEAVEDDDVVPALEQSGNEVQADEAGTPGDEGSHDSEKYQRPHRAALALRLEEPAGCGSWQLR